MKNSIVWFVTAAAMLTGDAFKIMVSIYDGCYTFYPGWCWSTLSTLIALWVMRYSEIRRKWFWGITGALLYCTLAATVAWLSMFGVVELAM